MIIDKEKLMNVMSVHDPKEKSGAEHKYWLIVGGGGIHVWDQRTKLPTSTNRSWSVFVYVCVCGGGLQLDNHVIYLQRPAPEISPCLWTRIPSSDRARHKLPRKTWRPKRPCISS